MFVARKFYDEFETTSDSSNAKSQDIFFLDKNVLGVMKSNISVRGDEIILRTELFPELTIRDNLIIPNNLSFVNVYDERDQFNNYFVQKQTVEWVRDHVVKKWLYKEFPDVLKYLKIENGDIKIVDNVREMSENDIGKDTREDVKRKARFIKENMITIDIVKSILARITSEFRMSWADLLVDQKLLKRVFGKYLRHNFKKLMNNKE